MVAKLLPRLIRAICLGGMALGMTTAMTQDALVVPQHVGAVDGERLVVVAYSDPEGEVGNGTNPPDPNVIDPEIEVDWEVNPSMNISNFPEAEISNGMDPPM